MTASERSGSRLLLVDTHTLIWMVEEAPRLGAQTAEALNRAGWENRIAVSAITPWEIALLVSKGGCSLAPT
jgi:PIN domain nuclease of toxin-antitoxin system